MVNHQASLLMFFSQIFFQEFPILCQTCLGDNPYIRMVRVYIIILYYVSKLSKIFLPASQSQM